jgi:hypothetical protein
MVVFLTHKSKRANFAHSPNYREIFFWQDKNKGYSLLLHSVTIYDSSFSAYSSRWDSLMNYSAHPSDLQSIKKKLTNISYSPQKCLNCHID